MDKYQVYLPLISPSLVFGLRISLNIISLQGENFSPKIAFSLSASALAFYRFRSLTLTFSSSDFAPTLFEIQQIYEMVLTCCERWACIVYIWFTSDKVFKMMYQMSNSEIKQAMTMTMFSLLSTTRIIAFLNARNVKKQCTYMIIIKIKQRLA
jgi:hypothetical protein